MANPQPGPHDSRGNQGQYNPATESQLGDHVGALTIGSKTFDSTKEPVAPVASNPR